MMMRKGKFILLILACCGLPCLCVANGFGSFIKYSTHTTFSSAFIISNVVTCSTNVLGEVSFNSRPFNNLISEKEIYQLVALLDGSYLARMDVSALRSKGMSRWTPREPRICLSIYVDGKRLCYLDFYDARSDLFICRNRLGHYPRMYKINNERLEEVQSIISKLEKMESRCPN